MQLKYSVSAIITDINTFFKYTKKEWKVNMNKMGFFEFTAKHLGDHAQS